MHRLKAIKDTLVNCIQSQLADIQNANTHELGEAIDMVKDLEQAMYYCSIVKAMEKEESEKDHCHWIPYPVDKVHEEEYYEKEIPLEFRDKREGRSPISRRNYMESKELHQDKEKKMRELEKYMKELSEDIVEMIEDASPEEKQMLEKKMTHLTSKIAQLNINA